MNFIPFSFFCVLSGAFLLVHQMPAQTAPVFTNVYDFDELHGSPGLLPQGTLVEGPDGFLYGTLEGGSNGGGLVFRITPDGQQATEVHGFVSNSSTAPSSPDGLGPHGPMLFARDGTLYGQTLSTLFKITPDGNLTTLHTFTGADGGVGFGPLVEGNDGNLYGATENSTYRTGTVFRMTPAGDLTVLHTFPNYVQGGSNPRAGLTLASDGNFYGTTTAGAAPSDGTSYTDAGTVFRVTPDGTFTYLHSFTGSDGRTPHSNLAEGPDGNLYGTTEAGGSYGAGTVYRITPDGVLTTLYNFSTPTSRGINADGVNPQGRFILGRDGNFYGTTCYGGANNAGVLFRVTPSGALTVLHHFTALVDPDPDNHGNHQFVNSDGYQPYYGISQASDGGLYGTTFLGGTSGVGVMFRLDPGSTGLPSEFSPALTSPLLLGATAGEPFAYNLTATNRPTSFTASPLPPGTNFDPARGLIAGVIPTPGTYVVNLGAANTYGNGAATFTLVVSPPRPALVLRPLAPWASFQEGQAGQFAVYLTEATTEDLTVRYTLAGSAVNGVDYRRLSGEMTIPAGQTYGLVDVVPKARLRGEGARSVLLQLAPGEGYTVQTRKAVRVTATYR